MNATQLNEHNPLELFNSCVMLAYKISSGIQRNNLRVEKVDMDQVALLALWQAALRYDPNSGNKFSTFATPSVHGQCLTYLRDFADLVKKPAKYFFEMPLQKRVVPSRKTEEEHGHSFMLDKLTADRTQSPLDLILEAEEVGLLKWELQECLECLLWEQQYCLERHAFHGDTYETIGKKLGKSDSWVSDCIGRACESLAGRKGGLCKWKQERPQYYRSELQHYEKVEKLKIKRPKVSGKRATEKPVKVKTEKPIKVKAEKPKKEPKKRVRKSRGGRTMSEWTKIRCKTTKETHEKILTLKAEGLTMPEIAKLAGCSYNTVYFWSKRSIAFWDE